MKKLPITDATDLQLKTFATDVQQLDGVPNVRSAILAALVEAGWTLDYIMVPGDEHDAPVLDQQVEPDEDIAEMPTKGFGFWMNPPRGAPKCPMVVCSIMSTDRPGGNEPAHPSINGSPPLVIQRNRLVRIPYDFYLDLKQAGGTKLVPGADATDDLIPQHYVEYPFSEVRLPPKAEVDAWQAYTGSIELGRPKAKAA